MQRLNRMLAFVWAGVLLNALALSAQQSSAPSIPPAASGPSADTAAPLPAAPQRIPPVQDQMKIVNPPPPMPKPHAPGIPEMLANPDGEGETIARAKEDFSNLGLNGSVLIPRQPTFGSREVGPDFTRELWQVQWRPNDPIDLYIIRPNKVARPPVVLYVYGYPTDTSRFKDDRFCKRITERGAAAIGIVSALTGPRYAYRPASQWFISEMPESLASTVHDIQLILTQLKDRQDLDMSHVGIFGQGSGGAIAILAAAADSRIEAVDLLDPWGDWPDWFAKATVFPEDQRPRYASPGFQKSLQPLEPLRYLPTLHGRRLRIQFMGDSGEPADAVRRLEAAAPTGAVVKHFATGRDMYQENSEGRLFEWLAQSLGAAPVPNTPAPKSTESAAVTPSSTASKH